MKNKILISIKPEFVESIVNGTKKFEYRRVASKKDIQKIIIYSTFPEKKIIGEAQILEILKAKPEELWNQTKEYSGITKEFFDLYFLGKEYAFAYKLGKIKVYKEPKILLDFGIKQAPQSFIYI